MENIVIEIKQLRNDCDNDNDNDNDKMIEFHLDIDYELYDMKKKELQMICDYYNLSYTRLKKEEMIEQLNEFEGNIENMDIVIQRRTMWNKLKELISDDYLSQYIVL